MQTSDKVQVAGLITPSALSLAALGLAGWSAGMSHDAVAVARAESEATSA